MKDPKKFRTLLSPGALAAAGVFCAGLLLVEVNVLAARHFSRVDVSQGARYTLSEPTRNLIEGLTEPVEVIVVLGSGDPLLQEVRQMLTAYRALSTKIRVRYVDPDRDTAEFLALSRKHNIAESAEPSGDVIAETALLIQKGERTWFVRGAQLSEMDADGNARLKVEASLTEGIAQVGQEEKTRICFLTGHGERSIDDSAPEGLIELRRVLERSNVAPERVPLDVPDPAAALSQCPILAIVGPERPWPSSHAEAVRKAVAQGTPLVAFIDPIVNSEGRVADPGLGPVLAEAGVIADAGFVLETSPEQRLPSGIGEAFFATPKTHSLTSGLSTDQARLDSKVLIVAAQPLRQAPGKRPAPLLQTTDQAVMIADLNRPDQRQEQEGPITVAYAADIPRDKGTQRLVVVGSSNVVTNNSFRDSSLYGSRVFSQDVFSWVLNKQTLVAVPDKPPVQAGLNLTEDSLSQLLRYVLIYMPLAAAMAGAYVLVRRRRKEDRSHPGGEVEA